MFDAATEFLSLELTNISYQIHEDSWHLPLLIWIFISGLTGLIYVLSKFLNFSASVISTRFYTDNPSKERAGYFTVEPEVTVQICSYNERNIVVKTIAAACQLDWPKDKLTVQLLDDSTDKESILINEECVRQWRGQGINIIHRSRPDRIGYKAGSLSYHFPSIKSDFVALFDADHRPEPDFLRKTIPCFYDKNGKSKRELGLVQTPWA